MMPSTHQTIPTLTVFEKKTLFSYFGLYILFYSFSNSFVTASKNLEYLHTFIEIILYRSNMKKKHLNNATYYENLKNLFLLCFFQQNWSQCTKKPRGDLWHSNHVKRPLKLEPSRCYYWLYSNMVLLCKLKVVKN